MPTPSQPPLHPWVSHPWLRRPSQTVSDCWWCVGIVVWCALLNSSAEAEVIGALQDGTRISDGQIRGWGEAKTTATLAGHPLFDARNPVQWMIDQEQPSRVQPARYVEFFGGDRLAGEVMQWLPGSADPYQLHPDALEIRTDADYSRPEDPDRTHWSVCAAWVKRIVWEPLAGPTFQPGTVWLRSGARISFRSVRWSAQEITLLTAEGVKRVAFSDLAELHSPATDPWQQYDALLAALSPAANSVLFQVEQLDGSCWTTSTERFQARYWGDPNSTDSWLHLIQPAWAIEPLCVRFSLLRQWRFWSPLEPPLSLFEPVRVTQQSAFGSSWKWQCNQSAHLGELATGDGPFGWGFGVHASTTLEYPLSDAIQAFRTQVGIDNLMGDGGCVNVSVAGGGANWQTEHLRGLAEKNPEGRATLDTDWLPIQMIPGQIVPGPAESPPTPSTLSLIVDQDHSQRPAGAEPFDIRDSVVWCNPAWRLAREPLMEGIGREALNQLPGLSGWQSTASEPGPVRTRNSYEEFEARQARFPTELRVTGPFQRWTRSWKFQPTDRWWNLSLWQPRQNSSGTTVVIRIDGRVAGQWKLQPRDNQSIPEPLCAPVFEASGKTVPVEVLLFPAGPDSYVEWAGQASSPDRAGTQPLLLDQLPAPQSVVPVGAALATNPDAWSGEKSLRIENLAVWPVTSQAASPPAPTEFRVSDQPALGEYRYLVWAWKQPGGTGATLQLQTPEGLMPLRTDPPGTDQLLVTPPLAGGPDQLPANKGLPNFSSVRPAVSGQDRGLKHGYAYRIGKSAAQPTAEFQRRPEPLNIDGSVPAEWQLFTRDLYGDFGSHSIIGIKVTTEGAPLYLDHVFLARTWRDMEHAKLKLAGLLPSAETPDNPVERCRTWQFEEFPLVSRHVAPQFALVDSLHGGVLYREQRGQLNVLMTEPRTQTEPVIFRTVTHIPAGRRGRLELRVSHEVDHDWKLVVRSGDTVLHEQVINHELTLPQRGWATLQVDLSSLAGRDCLLDVENVAIENGKPDRALWRRLEWVVE